MATDAKSLYVTALRNTHALESQGLQQMESQVKGLEHYPEYERLLRDHIEVTRRQLRRLDDALGALGESRSTSRRPRLGALGRWARRPRCGRHPRPTAPRRAWPCSRGRPCRS